MFPFSLSWPTAYHWMPSQINFGGSMNGSYLQYYNYPLQLVIPSTQNQTILKVEAEPLGETDTLQDKSSCLSQKKALKVTNFCRTPSTTAQNNHKRSQNPYRNILTNITNLILNFILSRKKVRGLLFIIDPTLSEDEETLFYEYIKYLKKFFCSYYNPNKLRKLFGGK